MASEDRLEVRSPCNSVIGTVQSEVEVDVIELRSSCDLVVETEHIEVQGDLIDLHKCNSHAIESGPSDAKISATKPGDANTESHRSALKEVIMDEKNLSQGKEDGEIEDDNPVQMELDNNTVHEPSSEHFKLNDALKKEAKDNGVSLGRTNGNDCITAENDQTTALNHGIDGSPVSGVKRARVAYDDQEPSVHIEYKSLTRASKKKLEELLQLWSQWHAEQKFSTNDPNQVLESGEQTFFPALYFGLEKASAVTFWMDNQTRKDENKFIPLDGDSVPMYDRGFALGLTSGDGSTTTERGPEAVEASRCFNCGSYSHGLKDCQKPRNNAAVDSARKQHNAKRLQTSGPRNSPRYYQNSPGGKYDGIKPGVLSSETRQLLGLGELDPPPWLQRMREIGYPPGYLDADYEDQPSGITIFADEEIKNGEEDGEILDTNNPEPKKKMAVEFPGINAPIPDNADERRWGSLPGTSSFDSSRNRLHPIPNRSSERNDSGRYGESRRSLDYTDDGPPGVGVDSPRYGGYDPNYARDLYSPRGQPTPTFGRSLSDRGRWSPAVYDSSPTNSPYSPVTYPSPNSLRSPPSYYSDAPDSRPHDNHHHSSSRRYDRHDHHHYGRT